MDRLTRALLGGLLAAALGWAQAPAEAQTAGRNILLLIADDQGVPESAFYPASLRQQTTPPPPPMPNVASLVRQGVTFGKVWATPWCSPTRAELFTGRYPFRTGIGRANTSNLPPIPLSEFSLPEAFRAGNPDYRVASFGKWHLSSGASDPNTHGWPHYAGMHPDLGHLPSYFEWPKTIDGATSTTTVYATTDIVDDVVEAIGDAEAARDPYFYWVAFAAPHDPWHKPPNELHSRDSLPVTGATSRRYFEAMTEALDTEIGRLLQAVDLATTTVIYVADNGSTGVVTVSPFSKSKAKGTVYQGGVRVPLVIAGAGVASPGRTNNQLVSAVDLFPTILELAGIAPASVVPAGTKIDGVTLSPYIANVAHPSPRRNVYTETFYSKYTDRFQRAIRNGTYKLIERYDGTREFYDLNADPLEKTNLLAGTLTTMQQTNLTSLDRAMGALLATK